MFKINKNKEFIKITTIFFIILMLFSVGILFLLINKDNDKNTTKASSTTATVQIYSMGYNSKETSTNYSPFSLSYSLLYDGEHTIVSGNLTAQYSYSALDGSGNGLYGGIYNTKTGTYEKWLAFIQKSRTLNFEITSSRSGCYIGSVYVTYYRGSTYVKEITLQSFSISNYKTSLEFSTKFDTGSATESNTNLYIYITAFYKYNLINYNSESYEFYTGYSTLIEQEYSGYNYSNFKRTGYTLEGFYTGKNGTGTKVFDVDDEGNIDPDPDCGFFYTPNSNLYANYIPNEYSVNINILGQDGVEDYQTDENGTFTLTTDEGTVLNGLYNEPSGSDAKISFDKSWTISNITPASGMKVESVTCGSGLTMTKSGNNYIFKCTGTSKHVITIKMKNYYKIDINFYKPDGSTQNGGTFNISTTDEEYTISNGNSLSNKPDNPYLNQNQTWTLTNIKGSTGTQITNIYLTTTTGKGTLTKSNSGVIWSCSYTTSDIFNPSGSWDNVICITTRYNVLRLNYYDKNTETNEYLDETYASSTYEYDNISSIVLKSMSNKTGYIFKGWSLTQNGDVITSTNSFNTYINDNDYTLNLYAIYEPISYKVIYNGNGNTAGATSSQTFTYNVSQNLSNNGFIKTGYIFDSWNTNANGTGTKYLAGQNVKNLISNPNADGSSTITLYAQWTAITYNISYNLNGGTNGNNTPSSAIYDQVILIDNPTKTGYLFLGWTASGLNTNTAKYGKASSSLNYQWNDTSKKITSNYFINLTSTDKVTVTLTAQWQATATSEAIEDGIESFNQAGTYEISNAHDLLKLAVTLEKQDIGNTYSFIQTNDIDLSGVIWLPMGNNYTFTGNYDGKGYKITNLTTSDELNEYSNYINNYAGLFANISGGTIKNLIIENATINGETAGIIAGNANSTSIIENCIVSGTVNGTTKGSIVGNGGQINNCLAINVNTSVIGNSETIKNCLYQLNTGEKGKINFNDYSGWCYIENLSYPIPIAIAWYPYEELNSGTLEKWLSNKN